METLQLLTRVDSEFIGENGPGVGVRGEGICLSTRAVESEHQQPTKRFLQRGLADHPLEFGNGRRVVSKGDVGLEAGLECESSQLS